MLVVGLALIAIEATVWAILVCISTDGQRAIIGNVEPEISGNVALALGHCAPTLAM